MRTLEEPGDLGQQVGAAARELSQRSHRGGFLVFGQLTPLSAMARLPRQLGDEEPVSLRPLIDHAF